MVLLIVRILRLLFYAKKIVKVCEPLYIYNRANESSALHGLDSKKQNDRCWCDMDIVSFFKENGVYNFYEEFIAYRVLAYTQEWILDKSRWNDFLQYYPESHKYIFSCKKVITWRKLLMWSIVHKLICVASVILFLKNISKTIRNA